MEVGVVHISYVVVGGLSVVGWQQRRLTLDAVHQRWPVRE